MNTVLFLSGRPSQAEESLTIMSWRRWGLDKGSVQCGHCSAAGNA